MYYFSKYLPFSDPLLHMATMNKTITSLSTSLAMQPPF